MEMPSRTVRILHIGDGKLLATDVAGRVHLLDEDLNLLRSSTLVPNGQPIYTVAVSGEYVVTKDKYGGIGRWSLPSLDLLDHLDAARLRGDSLLPGEEPSPVVNRGIGIWNDKVYVNNGYLQMVVIDLHTFRVDRIVPSMSSEYLEWFDFGHPTLHAVTDKQGQLFLGNVDEMDFPVQVQVDDESNLHRVVWDFRHERFWVTQDNGAGEMGNKTNGIVTLTDDGQVVDSVAFATDDVEVLKFSPDHRWAYSGGFDSELYAFDNSTPELRIDRKVATFGHNISDLTLSDRSDRLFVLTQDGVITALTPDGTRLARSSFRHQSFWDIEAHPDRPDRLLAGVDEGVAELIIERDGPPSEIGVRIKAQHDHGVGLTRRVVPLDDGGWVGVTRSQVAFRAREDGALVWHTAPGARLHTVSVDPSGSRVLLTCNFGAYELDAETGEVTDTLEVDNAPIWAGAYTPDGDRLLGGRNAVVRRVARDSHADRWVAAMSQEAYCKRFRFDGDRMFVMGGVGVHEFDPDTGNVLRVFSELLENTAEDTVVVDGRLYTCTYGHQLGVYTDPHPAGPEVTPELLGLIEPMPDITKALHAVRSADGTPYLLVGGRGGWLRTYRLTKEGPERVRDQYLRPVDPGRRDRA
ncbi:WD40 repeat domain-containing protein [Streptomyces sp. TS71-3]|uniref:WD40 repeat domain-containing protein n=1 Tax=Streptomyces sp. TS71-3 TaxID=2733862 RepID=UPI001B15B30E|nr:WD40 repeat domain-containing protein [Streptomyces sp. TS71-3]GHJ37124.1 hypothetical protein Sm713_27330 [Streptomyces sp. TS71-3]